MAAARTDDGTPGVDDVPDEPVPTAEPDDEKRSAAYVPLRPPGPLPGLLRASGRRLLRARVRARRRTRARMTEARTGRASAALSAILAALLASAGWYFVIGAPAGGQAADLVSDYLAAILDGDTEAALAIAGAEPAEGDEEFLTAEAVSSDWLVDSISAMPYSDEETHVAVRISDSDGRSTRGEFVVTGSSLDEQRIANPFAVVSVDAAAPGFLDLNGTVAAVVANDEGPSTHSVFPGAYDLYPTHESLLRVEPGRMLVLPSAGTTIDEEQPAQSLDFRLTATAEAQKAVQKTLDARIDECVESDELAPADCPFTAEDDLYTDTVTTDDQYFTDIEDISWKAERHPRIVLRSLDDGLALSLRTDTAATLTATGIPVFGDADDKRVEFSVDCPYEIGSISVRPTASGSFTLGMPDSDRMYADCELR